VDDARHKKEHGAARHKREAEEFVVRRRPPSLNGGRGAGAVMFALTALTLLMTVAAAFHVFGS